jgi:hypothetical protein
MAQDSSSGSFDSAPAGIVKRRVSRRIAQDDTGKKHGEAKDFS